MKATPRFLLLLAALVWVAVSCSLGGRLLERADGTPPDSPAPASPTAPPVSTADTPDLLPGTAPPPLETEAQPAVETPAQQIETTAPVSETQAPPPVETPTQPPETIPPVSETEALQAVETPEQLASPPATSIVAIPLLFSSCVEETCTYTGPFPLARPVAPPGRTIIDVSDRFGSYQRRTQAANHGVSFLNSTGTPVLAAAGGVVVVSGDDSQVNYGLRPDTYGSLVVLRHDLPGLSQPVFTLYAHLSQVFVKVDDPVQAGQEIGLVGMSGSVRGSTLHFEVRLGENTFPSARNPELWLAPLTDEAGGQLGVLAGRVLDSQGAHLAVSNILVEQLNDSGGPAVDQVYLKTYAEGRLVGLSPWEESFAAGDLPPGSYQISFWKNGLHQRVVQVLPGQLTFVTFRVP